MITVNKANPTPGEITSSLTGSTGDGAGLHLADGGKIEFANSAAAEFGTADFSIEFVLNQTGDNTSDNYIYTSHSPGNNRLYIWNDISANKVNLEFVDGSASASTKVLDYDMSADYGTVTHYVITCDRSGNATLYKNGNSVATVDISSTASIDIGAGNTNVGTLAAGTGYGVLGTFYRFRLWNKLADAKALFERSDVDYADQYGSQTIVIPGDFDGNLDGWDASNNWNSQTNPSNNMVLAASAVNQICRTSITLTKGKTYRCTYTASNITGSPEFANYTTAIPTTTGSTTISAGTNSFEFVFEAAYNNYFYIRATGATDAVTLDNVSVVQIGAVTDLDLAFANPTQSLTIQDRSTNSVDGTCSASGVTQVQPIIQGNLTSLKVGKGGQAAPADNQVLVDGGVVSTPAYSFTHTPNTGMWSNAGGVIQFATLGTNSLTIDANGAVGLARSATSGYRLDVHGRSGYDDVVLIEGNGTNMGPRINLTPTGTGISRINATANDLALQTGGTSRLSISSTGIITAASQIKVTASSASSVAYSVGDAGTGWYNTGSNAIGLATNGAQRINVSNSGLATFSNGIAFSQTNTSATGATATGTTLDHYEEGTWTADLNFGNDNTGIVYASNGNQGYYCRIGHLVYVSCIVALSNKGSETGSALISGLPFGVADKLAATSVENSLSTSYNNLGIGSLFIYAAGTGGHIYLRNSSNSQLTNSNFANDSSMRISGWYTTT